MRRLVVVVLLFVASFAQAASEVTRLGLYLQGARIGEATYKSAPDTLEGVTLTRGESHTLISTNMLGSSMTIEMRSTSWTDAKGRPVRMTFTTTSAGRKQTVDARFGTTHADVTVEAGGSRSTKRLQIPTGGPVVEDPLPIVLAEGSNARRTFYVLRPDTVSFVKNEVVLKGPATARLGDRDVQATLVEVIDPMATMKIFVSAKGDLIKAEGPLGIEMIPEGAGNPSSSTTGAERPDLAKASSIVPDKSLGNAARLRRLTLRLEGSAIEGVPSDDHQTARKEGDMWLLDIHPPRFEDTPGLTLKEAAAAQPKWVEPDTYIPADSPQFKTLARKIIGSHTRVRDASLAVQIWIAQRMRANTGIGVLRDATEILESQEGVCRDSAILATTILRAGGVPTRLASGLVSWDGTFYYHAWVEVWDGRRWLGIDPTTTEPQLSASHVKLSGGNIADAFRFPLLDKVSIKIVRAQEN